ncbi:MAG: recombinase family protein [Gammaproteobacteria bacterium]
MTKRVAIYARVSKKEQTPDNQLLELRLVAERMGWTVVHEFVDHGISGIKGKDERPEFDRLHKSAVRREIDLVAVWSVDRIGRSLQHLVAFLTELHAKGVDLYLHQQGIDTTTPGGKAMFQMLGVFAEFERAIIRERVLSGLDRARAQGKRLGRPKVSNAIEVAVLKARDNDGGRPIGKKRIAADLGIGVGTVQRIIAEADVN